MFGTKGINTEALSQTSILNRVSEYDLWRYYLGEFSFNKAFKSPLREDKNPSAVLFVAGAGKILFKDFGINSVLNIFSYLKAYYNLDYYQVLLMIDKDFNLGFRTHTNKDYTLNTKPVITNYKPEPVRDYVKILIKRKKYTKEELKYWEDYSITKETLDLYNVYSLKCFWINKHDTVYQYCNNAKNFIFCYDFDNEKYKIYQPLNFNYRFFTNTDSEILQGEKQLPKSGDLLIITKALKDVMVLRELGFTAVAVQSENSFPSQEKIEELKLRFKSCIILFDNDKAGLEGAKLLGSRHDLKFMTIPREYKIKDIADFCKQQGKEQTKINLQLWIETELH